MLLCWAPSTGSQDGLLGAVHGPGTPASQWFGATVEQLAGTSLTTSPNYISCWLWEKNWPSEEAPDLRGKWWWLVHCGSGVSLWNAAWYMGELPNQCHRWVAAVPERVLPLSLGIAWSGLGWRNLFHSPQCAVPVFSSLRVMTCKKLERTRILESIWATEFRWTQLESLLHFMAWQSCTGELSSLSLAFFICKVRIAFLSQVFGRINNTYNYTRSLDTCSLCCDLSCPAACSWQWCFPLYWWWWGKRHNPSCSLRGDSMLGL